MTKLSDQILRIIQQNAARETALLANEYIKASPAEREAIQAGIHIERWLAISCQQCLE